MRAALIFNPTSGISTVTEKRSHLHSLRVTTDTPVEIHADGELLGYTPAKVTVLPGALRIRVSGKDAPGLHESAVGREDSQVLI